MAERHFEAGWLELSEILRTTGQPQAIDRRGQIPAPPVPRSDDRATALGFVCGYAYSNQGALSTGLRRTSNAPISRRSSVTRGSVRWMLLLVGDTTITNTSPTHKFRSCAFAIMSLNSQDFRFVAETEISEFLRIQQHRSASA